MISTSIDVSLLKATLHVDPQRYQSRQHKSDPAVPGKWPRHQSGTHPNPAGLTLPVCFETWQLSVAGHFLGFLSCWIIVGWWDWDDELLWWLMGWLLGWLLGWLAYRWLLDPTPKKESTFSSSSCFIKNWSTWNHSESHECHSPVALWKTSCRYHHCTAVGELSQRLTGDLSQKRCQFEWLNFLTHPGQISVAENQSW
jgi:hypothetical protein